MEGEGEREKGPPFSPSSPTSMLGSRLSANRLYIVMEIQILWLVLVRGEGVGVGVGVGEGGSLGGPVPGPSVPPSVPPLSPLPLHSLAVPQLPLPTLNAYAGMIHKFYNNNIINTTNNKTNNQSYSK